MIIDWILNFLFDFASTALAWLPDSPFESLNLQENFSVFADVMGYINYFVPVSAMLSLLTVYLTAVLLWYGVRWILRLAQYIS